MATVSQWNPFGAMLDITATAASVARISATQYQVKINVSWKTYWSNTQTWYKMEASSGGKTVVLHNGTYATNKGSGTLTGTYSISGNGSATKTITVVFKNTHPDKPETYKTKNVTFDVTVPAWTSYTVTYNANGGSGAPGKQTKWKDQSLTLSSTKPTLTGYTFQGWALSKAEADAGTWYYKAGGTCGKNENLTLYAVWSANQYTITFNGNASGVTNLPAAQKKTYNANLKLTTSKPTRADYNFLGWAESATGAVVYQPGATYSKNITAGVPLYAVWELAYTKPRISNASIFRTELDDNEISTGVLKDDSPFIAVSFKVESDKQLTKYRIEWTSTTDNGSFEINYASGLTEDENIGSVIENPGGSPHEFSTELTYTFTLTIWDELGFNTAIRTGPGTKCPIDIRKRGTGMAFNKPAELDGVCDIGFKVRHYAGLLYPELPANAILDECLTPNSYVGGNATEFNYAGVPAEIGNSTFTLDVISAGLEGQVIQRITRCHKTDPKVLERHYHRVGTGSEMTFGPWSLIRGTQNIECTWADGVTVTRYSMSRQGDMVTMYVCLKYAPAINAGSSITIGTIPKEHAPARSVATVGICGTTGTAVCWVQNNDANMADETKTTCNILYRPNVDHAANNAIEFNLTWNVAAIWN